jgi:hypothetical protein
VILSLDVVNLSNKMCVFVRYIVEFFGYCGFLFIWRRI